MSKIGKALITIVLMAFPAFAQPITSVEQLPALDRTKEDFYGAIVGAGPRVQVEWLMSSNSVERGGELILTLVVTNAANPSELQRPNLKDRPEFRELFDVIENLPEKPDPKRVEFRYKLRPRNEGTIVLPLPRYRYYVPQLPEGRRFQLANAPELKLTVTKPAPTSIAAVPISAPGEFFRLPSWWHESSANSPPSSEWRNTWWIVAMLFPLLASILGIASYRYFNPDAVKRAELLRRSEVRKTLQRLNDANDTEALATAIHSYLQDRWHIPTLGLSSREIADAFADVNIEGARELQQIFERCERLRFGGGNDSIPREDAKAWVLAVETESQ